MHISDCSIDTHDDCITLRASGAERLTSPQNCEYVTVTNCILSSGCNAIRLGVGEGTIKDAAFSNIVTHDSKTAFNIVSGYSREDYGASIESIRFSNIIVNAERLMKIHHMRGEGEIRDITFDGISGRTQTISQIWAKKSHPFKNIILREVNTADGYECINADVTNQNSSFQKIRLSGAVLRSRRQNIEKEKNLLY